MGPFVIVGSPGLPLPGPRFANDDTNFANVCQTPGQAPHPTPEATARSPSPMKPIPISPLPIDSPWLGVGGDGEEQMRRLGPDQPPHHAWRAGRGAPQPKRRVVSTLSYKPSSVQSRGAGERRGACEPPRAQSAGTEQNQGAESKSPRRQPASNSVFSEPGETIEK